MNKNLSKKWTFLWFWTWKNTWLWEKFDHSLTIGSFPVSFIPGNNDTYMEVQFRFENTYVQLRVWLQYANKNYWIILREQRKYYVVLDQKECVLILFNIKPRHNVRSKWIWTCFQSKYIFIQKKLSLNFTSFFLEF